MGNPEIEESRILSSVTHTEFLAEFIEDLNIASHKLAAKYRNGKLVENIATRSKRSKLVQKLAQKLAPNLVFKLVPKGDEKFCLNLAPKLEPKLAPKLVPKAAFKVTPKPVRGKPALNFLRKLPTLKLALELAPELHLQLGPKLAL